MRRTTFERPADLCWIVSLLLLSIHNVSSSVTTSYISFCNTSLRSQQQRYRRFPDDVPSLLSSFLSMNAAATGGTGGPSSATRKFTAAAKKAKLAATNTKPICVNRVARHQYHILNTFEAGISLTGTEVKAIRDGKMNLRDGYIKSDGRTCTLLNVHIGKHTQSGPYFQHEEKRIRTLLLHKAEARKLFQQTDHQPGMTIVPLKAYWNEDNRVKLEIGLCRGKNVRDKRADIQQRDAKREEQRIIKSFRVV